MATIVIEERIWNAADASGKLLLSKEARQYITHNGKWNVRWLEK